MELEKNLSSKIGKDWLGGMKPFPAVGSQRHEKLCVIVSLRLVISFLISLFTVYANFQVSFAILNVTLHVVEVISR